MLLDLQYRDFRPRQDALADGGFGILEFRTVIGDDGGPADTDGIGAEIKVYPLQSKQFGVVDAGDPCQGQGGIRFGISLGCRKQARYSALLAAQSPCGASLEQDCYFKRQPVQDSFVKGFV